MIMTKFKEFGRVIVAHVDSALRDVDVQQDKFLEEIFAPDPRTGVPRSDLHFIFSADKSPAVAEYVQNVLQMNHKGSISSLPDDPDSALDLVQGRMTDAQYVEKLTSIIKGE